MATKATTDQTTADQTSDDRSKAEQDRLDYFYANHRPPEGYAAKVEAGKLVIRKVGSNS